MNDLETGKNYRTEIPVEGNDMYGDGTSIRGIKQYSHLIPYIVVFAIVVALVRGAVPKHERRGCTIIVLFAFIVFYFLNRCIHL